MADPVFQPFQDAWRDFLGSTFPAPAPDGPGTDPSAVSNTVVLPGPPAIGSPCRRTLRRNPGLSALLASLGLLPPLADVSLCGGLKRGTPACSRSVARKSTASSVRLDLLDVESNHSEPDVRAGLKANDDDSMRATAFKRWIGNGCSARGANGDLAPVRKC
jgi:hypothetical protein